MVDALVLISAAAIAGGLVWRLTAGPGGGHGRARRRLRFADTLEVTALPVADAGYVGTSAIAFEEMPADPPRRTWSAIRLVALILGVAGAGAALIWALFHLLNQVLASRLTAP